MRPSLPLLIVKNSRGETIASRCVHANTLTSRIVGLLNRSNLNEDEALLIDPCNSVHTLFMRFAIDVVFLDAQDEVLGISQMKPWRISAIFRKARRVLELPYDSSKKHSLRKGEKLEFCHV